MDEFGLIRSYFAPLAKDFPGSLNLSDDAAIIGAPAGQELVITKDALSAGVHFTGDEEPALIARKLLRVNLSDLAAMGATPLCYLLAIMLPAQTKSDWVKQFAQGLAEDQKQFGIHLAGGDTTATKGTLSFSVTALGTVPAGKALRRNSAKIGDDIYVSGTLGDSALGLALLKGLDSRLRGNDKMFLEQRYYLPEPRIALGQKLIGIAHGCMDISDGLVQDLGHICSASNVGATIYSSKIPLSQAAKQSAGALEAALSGGDDYELLFTAAPDKAPALQKLSAELNVPITRIGSITEGGGIDVLDESGNKINLAKKGYRHFN